MPRCRLCALWLRRCRRNTRGLLTTTPLSRPCRMPPRLCTCLPGWYRWRTGWHQTHARTSSPTPHPVKTAPPLPHSGQPMRCAPLGWMWAMPPPVSAAPVRTLRGCLACRVRGPCRKPWLMAGWGGLSSWKQKPAAARPRPHCGAFCTCGVLGRWTRCTSPCLPAWLLRSCMKGCAPSWSGPGRKMRRVRRAARPPWSCVPCQATPRLMATPTGPYLTTRCCGTTTAWTPQRRPSAAGRPSRPNATWPPPLPWAPLIRPCWAPCAASTPTCASPC